MLISPVPPTAQAALTYNIQELGWDAENRLASIAGSGTTTSFVYDGDGKRVKKVEGATTTTYVNQYYEKTGDVVTTNYYLGSKLVAQKKGSALKYIYQDSLGSTSATSDTSGGTISRISYFAFGETRSTSGTLPIDKLFTGQRRNPTGLYYYTARYYDPAIGRFISADTVTPSLNNPQALNRYSYVYNNPLKYNDPTGHWPKLSNIGHALKQFGQAVASATQATVSYVSQHADTIHTVLNVAGMIPGVGTVCDVVNGALYAAQGDALNAALSFSSAIPVVGDAIGGIRTVAKVADRLTDGVKGLDEVENLGAGLGLISKKVHGNTANDAMATLYGKVDKDGNLLKWGVTKDLKTRYTRDELDGGQLIPIETGSRKEMLKRERELVETAPGTENHEPWAGIWYYMYNSR